MKIILLRSRAIDSAVFKVAETLHQKGHYVHLLVWDRQQSLKDNTYPFKISTFNVKASHDNAWVLFYLPLWWIYEFYFLLKNNSDIIHACDLDTLLPAVIVKIVNKKTLFYTIYDFYANHLVNKFILNFIKIMVANTEIFLIQKVDALFLTCEHRLEEIKNTKIKNLVYIYNSPPDLLKTNQNNSDSRKESVIFYGGMLDKVKGLNYIIKAIEDLENVKLIIAGTGPYEDIIAAKSQNLEDKVNLIGWIPYHEILARTIEADILFIFSDPKISRSRYICPNKLFEAMMAGKPIIMNKDLLASKIVENEKCGLLVDYGNVNDIKNALLKLINDPRLCEKLGNNGRKAYENKYSWKIMEKRLLNEYNQIQTIKGNYN